MSIVFVNGRVYVGPGRSAEALVAKHGRIAAVGASSALRDAYPEARAIDLRGGLLVPGFTDAHCHFLWWAIQATRLDLSETSTLDAALAKIGAHARSLREDAWLVGGRFDKNVWGRWPHREELDRVSRGHPAVLRSRDGHSRWANSRALAVAGVTRDTPTPEGGEIERDASGQPTGVLGENAIRLLDAVIPQPTRDDVRRALRWGQTEAVSRGLTAIHDLDNPMPDAHRGFQELLDVGALHLRVHMGIPHARLDAAIDLGIRTGLGSEWLQFSNLKIFTDGALGSQTAALEQSYEGTDYAGVLTVDRAQLRADVQRAADAGIGVAIHAIGDRAVRVALDAIEAAGGSRGRLRHRLEHIQLIRDDDITRFARLGVIASMQPIHATSDRDIADRYWGARCARAYTWRSLRDAGVTLAFGSDAPVEPIDPLLGMYAAITRKRPADVRPWYPEQRITLDDAIAGYTSGAAFAVGREAELGTLEVGKWCDAVVLARDIFREPAEVLLDPSLVRATITAGEVRYDGGLG